MDIISLKRELHKKSFYHFIKDYWHTIEAVDFIESNMMRYLADLFQFAIRRKLPEDIQRHWIKDNDYIDIVNEVSKKEGNIIEVRSNPKQHWNINMPPRHAKSLILNIFASVWLYAVTEGDQTIKVATMSHTGSLAGEMNDRKQQIINSPEFQEEFSHIKPIVNQRDRIIGSNLAEIYSVAMDSMTGRGLNYAILDDLVTAQTAVKQREELRNALRFMQNTLPSRMNKIDEDSVIHIAQRLGPGDVSDYIMTELGDVYQTVKLQAIAEEDTHIVFPCSGEVWTIKKGESLLPERFSVDSYNLIRKQMGNTYFEAQYQQNAIPADETIIKPDVIQYMNEYEAEDIINNYDQIYASHDLAVNDKSTSDMHGALIAYKKGSTLLITDAMEKHMNFKASQTFIQTLASVEDYRGIIQLIENKANGAVIIQTLQSTIPGIIEIEPGSRSKSERLQAASVWMDTKSVYFLTNKLNQPSPAIIMAVDRITKYPFVKHDDIVDAFSQLINYVYIQKSFGLFEQSLGEENYINRDLSEFTRNIYVGVTREGFEYAMLKVAYDYAEDTFYVIDEKIFRANDIEAVKRIKEFVKGSRMLVDASKDNVLYNTLINKIPIVNNSDSRSLSQQIAQLNLGFVTRQIQFSRHCVEFRNDLDRISWDDKALADGREKLKNRERLVSCLKTIVYLVKGDGEFY